MVIELKKPGVPARAAFDENLTHYTERIDTSPLILLPMRCGEEDVVLVQPVAHRVEWQGHYLRICLVPSAVFFRYHRTLSHG